MTETLPTRARRAPLTALISGAFALIAAACSPSSEAPAGTADTAPPADAGVVNVYSTRHYDSDRAMFDAFTEKTGIKVRVRPGGSAELLETLRQEGSASPADLVISADAGTLWLFQDAGLLQSLPEGELDGVVPDELREPGGQWVGLSQRLRVIVIDPSRVPDGAITSYEDLADPQWKGEICARSSTNVYNLSLLGDLIDRWGEDKAQAWATGVAANFARDPQGGDSDQIKAVAAGECSIAISNHYYWLRLANSGSASDREATAKTKLVFPDQQGDGAHRNITGAGLAANAPNRDNAIRLIEYMASAEGQPMLVVETGELPILDGVEGMPGLDPVRAAKVRVIDLSILGRNQALARRIFDEAGWN